MMNPEICDDRGVTARRTGLDSHSEDDDLPPQCSPFHSDSRRTAGGGVRRHRSSRRRGDASQEALVYRQPWFVKLTPSKDGALRKRPGGAALQ